MNTSLAAVFMDCRDEPGNDTKGEWRATPDIASVEANSVDDAGEILIRLPTPRKLGDDGALGLGFANPAHDPNHLMARTNDASNCAA